MLLRAGDLLVVNASATLPAALPAARPDGTAVTLHLSQHLPDGHWIVELRDGTTGPLRDATSGETLALPGNGRLTIHTPIASGTRLWRATLDVGEDVLAYLARHGAPIRYRYVPRAWPLEAYQTSFAREPGSAEMPSAGRPFTRRTLAALARRGVDVAPIVLHTGVSSLEDHEPPYAERFRVDAETARRVNAARARGGRVVAVGTTVVRALESAARPDGTVVPDDGWTDLVVRPHDRLRAVDALLTGFHEPRASHLAMLEALAGRAHVERAYAAALRERYLWHEFGDVHLIVAGRRGAW
jgi:S-adenosylmethionine:tRNA ribosyltransferase-isomerase